jgi:ketosteroid isomerase-like protein
MSQENVDLIRGMLDRFRSGDLSSWRTQVAEDVVWDTSATTTTTAGLFHGHAGVERFFADWLGTWDDPQLEVLELIDAGESVVSVFRWTGTGKTSGLPIWRDFFAVYDVRDGNVSRYRQYDTRAEALEAAGLREEDLKPAV